MAKLYELNVLPPLHGRKVKSYGHFASFQGFNFGALNTQFPVIGNVGFNNSWTFDDWLSSNQKWANHIKYWFQLDYTPLDPNTRTTAETKWAGLVRSASNGSVPANTMLNNFRSQLDSLTQRADANTSAFDALGNASDATHRTRYEIFNQINAVIADIARITVPADPGAGNFDPSSIPTTPAAGSPLDPSQLISIFPSKSKASSTQTVSSTTSPAAIDVGVQTAALAAAKKKADDDKKKKMLLIGGAAVVGLGLLFVMTTPKKGS